jgi:hypothetical protein
MFLSTDTSGSIGPSGFGRLGGSPGGTSRMSRDKCSENGLDVYRCWNNHRKCFSSQHMSLWRVNTYHMQNVWDRAQRSWTCTRFEVFTAVLLKNQVFWDMTLSHWWEVSDVLKNHGTFRMLWTVCPTTQHNIQDNLRLQVWPLSYNHKICVPQSPSCIVGECLSCANYIDGSHVLPCLVSGKCQTSGTLTTTFEKYCVLGCDGK